MCARGGPAPDKLDISRGSGLIGALLLLVGCSGGPHVFDGSTISLCVQEPTISLRCFGMGGWAPGLETDVPDVRITSYSGGGGAPVASPGTARPCVGGSWVPSPRCHLGRGRVFGWVRRSGVGSGMTTRSNVGERTSMVRHTRRRGRSVGSCRGMNTFAGFARTVRWSVGEGVRSPGRVRHRVEPGPSRSCSGEAAPGAPSTARVG